LTLPLERIARDALLPRLAGFRLVSPSPFDWLRQPSVLLYREPIEDVLVGVHLVAVDDREFTAQYVAQPLFAPTDYPGFQAVGMDRDGFIRFFRDPRWVLDGRHDAQVVERLVTYVVEEGIPILRRLGALDSFADELIDEHEVESHPIGNEEAAYAWILTGRDDRAIEILEALIKQPGRGWPGETEISEDEMNVLRERARRMLVHLRGDRSAAFDQLRRWRVARLASLGLEAQGPTPRVVPQPLRD
jgi:hypothetical protein